MPDERLRRSADIRRALRSGTRAHGQAAVVHVRGRADAAAGRWTVIAGRKVGGAVRRNRAKRRLRAVVREQGVPTGADVVVVARSAAVDVAYPELRAEVGELLDRALAPQGEAA